MVSPRTEPYMPEEYAAKLQAARADRRKTGERRVITMLFCDVRGSTALAENLDPEEWTEIMNECFEYLVAPIYRYEGTVARLMGDGLLAFFGAPIAHEDDPQRAVLAGLDIVKGIRQFANKIKQNYGMDFDVRVGINTGPVVVGDVGSELAAEYTAMGDAMNVASRMEQTALPGTVQITEQTFAQVGALFDVWDVGPVLLKGKERRVHAFRVLGWKSEPGRVRGIEGRDSPLVGRDTELGILRQAVRDVTAGRGGIVCLIGEAGLGKSRLIKELSDEWRRPGSALETPLFWLESRGISYEEKRPYGLFQQFIRQNFGVRENDQLDIVRAKIAQGSSALNPDVWGRMARLAGALLRVAVDSDSPGWEGEGFKRELFSTLLEATRTVASQQPTVLACDDLHWVDPASAELLEHFFRLVPELPLLFICAFRGYNRSPGWKIVSAANTDFAGHYTEIQLQPLSDTESDALAANLLAVKELPLEVRQSILRRAEGNPFFVEEVVRTLIDAGAIIQDNGLVRLDAGSRMQDLTIPDNVQSLLIARIDRLEKETRQTLQLAAVIGRTFLHRVLQSVSGNAVALDRQLDSLQHAGLIQEAARVPELLYTFRHALTRDAAYASILHRRRREYHRIVAETIERLYPNHLEDEAHRLAEHYDHARDFERAVTYYTMAGDRAARIYANAEASDHYLRAIQLERQIDNTNQTLISLYTTRGRVLEIAARYDEALDNYRELEKIGRERNERALELAALIPRATLRSTLTEKFDPQRGRELAERALLLAEELGDARAESKALWNLMLLAVFADDDLTQALFYGERSLKLARENDLHNELAYTLHDIANVYLDVGRAEDAWLAFEEAGAYWRSTGNLPMLVDCLCNSSWYLYKRGKLNAAFARVKEGLEVSHSIGSMWGQAYSLFTLCPLYLAAGDYAQAIQTINESIPLAQEANFAFDHELTVAKAGIYGFLGDLARSYELLRNVLVNARGWEEMLVAETMLALVHLYYGHLTPAKEAFDHARELSKSGTANPTLSIFGLVAPMIEAELAYGDGDYEKAAAIAELAVAGTQRRTVRASLRWILGQAHLELGRIDRARDVLREVREEADAPDSDRMTWLILYLLWARRAKWQSLLALSRIQSYVGNDTDALVLSREAEEYVLSIANGISAPETREAFLNLPEVRAILAIPRDTT